MSDVISQSRASLLVKGFENAAPLGLPKHGPALSPSVFISAISGSTLSCQLVWFVVQISPRAIRIEGQPCEHVPSGSTTHPSEQQAGDVASHIALRVNCSRVSGVNPSFSRASVALIR